MIDATKRLGGPPPSGSLLFGTSEGAAGPDPGVPDHVRRGPVRSGKDHCRSGFFRRSGEDGGIGPMVCRRRGASQLRLGASVSGSERHRSGGGRTFAAPGIPRRGESGGDRAGADGAALRRRDLSCLRQLPVCPEESSRVCMEGPDRARRRRLEARHSDPAALVPRADGAGQRRCPEDR